MLVGHFAVGLLAKRAEPRVSLGTFVLAPMLVDLLWCLFMLAGLEYIRVGPGIGAANYLESWNAALSHSLVMNTVWAALFAAGYFAIRHFPRGAWLIFAAVLTHWPLDALAHRSRMPLAPGVSRQVGLGLWASVPATLIVEGGFWLVAVFLYVRATRAARRAGVYVFCIGIAVLTLSWYNNIAGPAPANPDAIPVASLTFFSLAVAWAYWMNRLRPTRIGI